jgi:GNAT superfamily N-acetyltransferase
VGSLSIRLERVVDALPAGFAAMRDEARAEGFGMLDVLAGAWEAGAVLFDRDGEALFAGYVDEVFAGVGGMTHDPHSPAYSPGPLRMRRFYVRAPYRRLGVARAIATALLARPEIAGRVITVNAAPGSEAFWRSLGFVATPRERQTHLLAR